MTRPDAVYAAPPALPVERIPTGRCRLPYGAAGMSTVTLVAGDINALVLMRYYGVGQTMSAVAVATTGTVLSGGTHGFDVVTYPDADGTGAAPSLTASPTTIASIDITGAVGEKAASSTFVEPIGWYWVGSVYRSTGVVTTYPTGVTASTVFLLPPATASATSTTRDYRLTGVTGAPAALGSLPTSDGTARTVVYVRAA